jgi:hypothetical protein
MFVRGHHTVRRLVRNFLKFIDLISSARRLERIDNLLLVFLDIGAPKHLSRDLGV